MEKITWHCNKCTLGMKYVQKNFRSSAFGGQPNSPSTIGHQTWPFFFQLKTTKTQNLVETLNPPKCSVDMAVSDTAFVIFHPTRVLGYWGTILRHSWGTTWGTRILGYYIGYQGTRVLQGTIGYYWVLYTRVHQGTCTKATKAFNNWYQCTQARQ